MADPSSNEHFKWNGNNLNASRIALTLRGYPRYFRPLNLDHNLTSVKLSPQNKLDIRYIHTSVLIYKNVAKGNQENVWN